jgi:uncharacterized membrane protein
MGPLNVRLSIWDYRGQRDLKWSRPGQDEHRTQRAGQHEDRFKTVMVDIAPRGGLGSHPKLASKPQNKRLIGIDAARGLALIGLMAVHILPDSYEDTGDPTWSFNLFYGDSAALFALLAGVGLALTSGGQRPHSGRQMFADKVGVAARAVVIGIVALIISALIQPADVESSILPYYSVFFLLAILFLTLSSRALFIAAAAFLVTAPILMQQVGAVLPEWSDSNPGVWEIFNEPVETASQLLLTGTYPALPYMTYLLVGLGIGRLNLRSTRLQAIIAGVGAALAVLANLVSSLLLYAVGGYEALLGTEDMTMDDLDEALVYGPDVIPDDSGWWLTIATPHTNTPLALASSLGIALLVLGVFLLLSAKAGRWLKPLATMGAMTFTLYSAHLVALALNLHDDQPALWFVVHVGAAVAFAWFWHRSFRRGPLETVVHRAVTRARSLTMGTGRNNPSGVTGPVEGGNISGRPDGTTGESTARPHTPSSDG